MRIGIDLLAVDDPDLRLAQAVAADRLGLWAVLVGGVPGTETVEATTIAAHTSSLHVAVMLDGRSEHPLTLAEEVSVLDHLSERRALAIVDGGQGVGRQGVGRQGIVEHVTRLLAGHIVDGVALSPPPAQTRVPVWAASEVMRVELTGDIGPDGQTVDRHRNEGCTHLFVTWPGSLPVLARHLVTRAAGPAFPSIVAELADRFDPPGG